MKRFFSTFFLLLPAFLFAQIKLTTTNASWNSVIPGRVISTPVSTSFGFSIITDAQQVSTFTNSGKIIWEKSFTHAKNAFISALNDNFITIVTHNGTNLILLNQSGCKIWEKETAFKIIDHPFSGRDGRFFARGSNNIICFSINGIIKYQLETQLQSPLPPQELNDGSLIFFMEQKNDGKSTGLRVSPFGEVLEEITFSGEISKALSCSEGVLLNFTDGTAGLFSVQEGIAQNKWVLLISESDKNQFIKSCFAVTPDKQKVIFILPSQNSAQAYIIDQKNGSIKDCFTISEINGFNISQTFLNDDGIYLADDKNGFFYSYSGAKKWMAELPSKNSQESYNYSFLTNDNHLILCTENWNINSYRLSPPEKNKKATTSLKTYPDFIKSDNSDSSFYALQTTGQIDREVINSQRITQLQNGNYGPKEIIWYSQMLQNCQELQNVLQTNNALSSEKSYFETDSDGINKLLQQLPLYSTAQSASYCASFIKNMTNISHISTLLSGIAKSGYDPEGKILNAIEICASKYKNKDDQFVISACDAVYAICLFMGRPAFNSKGKAILARFIGSSYSTKASAYTRKTLKKISDLDL